MNLAETIYQKSLDLPEEKAIEVIDFIDFLKNRSRPNQLIGQSKALQNETKSVQEDQQDINRHAGKLALSCLDLIKEDVGVIENAPSDLSTNPAHLKGYGE
jgi:hypothetical protein